MRRTGSQYEATGIMAPSVGEYRTDGVSLIYVDAVLIDDAKQAGQNRQETICVVEVDTVDGLELKEMSLSQVAELKPVKRG